MDDQSHPDNASKADEPGSTSSGGATVLADTSATEAQTIYEDKTANLQGLKEYSGDKMKFWLENRRYRDKVHERVFEAEQVASEIEALPPATYTRKRGSLGTVETKAKREAPTGTKVLRTVKGNTWSYTWLGGSTHVHVLSYTSADGSHPGKPLDNSQGEEIEDRPVKPRAKRKPRKAAAKEPTSSSALEAHDDTLLPLSSNDTYIDGSLADTQGTASQEVKPLKGNGKDVRRQWTSIIDYKSSAGQWPTLTYSMSSWKCTNNPNEVDVFGNWIQNRRKDKHPQAMTKEITAEQALEELEGMPLATYRGKICKKIPPSGSRVLKLSRPGRIQFSWLQGKHNLQHLIYQEGSNLGEDSSATSQPRSSQAGESSTSAAKDPRKVRSRSCILRPNLTITVTETDCPDVSDKGWTEECGIEDKDLVDMSEIKADLKDFGICPTAVVYQASKVGDEAEKTTTYKWFDEGKLHAVIVDTKATLGGHGDDMGHTDEEMDGNESNGPAEGSSNHAMDLDVESAVSTGSASMDTSDSDSD